MSWSIDVTGSKSDVAEKVTNQLDKIAERYKGNEEGKDVLVAKERILAIVQAVDLPASGFGPNVVHVKAAGSHILNENGISSAQMTFIIARKRVD
jgi:hypothetical protein